MTRKVAVREHRFVETPTRQRHLYLDPRAKLTADSTGSDPRRLLARFPALQQRDSLDPEFPEVPRE
jgi:hypothetical protein